MRIAESELIINPDGSVFHLHLRPDEISDDIILVGDPGRVPMIAGHLTGIDLQRSSREFNIVGGYYKGKRLTVLSTGIGIGNIDIVMTELDALANVDFSTRLPRQEHRSLNVLRIGTSGSIRPEIPIGAYVFSAYSAGFDGLLNWYADRDRIVRRDMEEAFVAQTGWDARLSAPYFVQAGKEMTARFEDCAVMGITMSAIGFYGPQGRSIRLSPVMPDMLERLEKWSFDDGGRIRHLTNFEMESSAIAGLAAHLGHNAGTVCCIIANRHIQNSKADYKPIMEGLVEASLERLVK